MKTLIAAAISLTATSAIAHEGAHMHPHGMESAWGYALVALLATGATLLAVRARR